MVIVAGYRTQFVAPELPLQALDRVDLSDVGRVWFFSTAFNPAAAADIRKALVKSGLRHADSPPGGPQPYLSVFERR
jgi:hypothetical protein